MKIKEWEPIGGEPIYQATLYVLGITLAVIWTGCIALFMAAA